MRLPLQIVAVGWTLFSVALALAETVELVTYYPATATTGDLHTRSLTVGNDYLAVGLDDGEAIIRRSLGIGPGFDAAVAAGPLHVVGENNVVSNVLFMPGGGTGEMRVGIGTETPSNTLHILSGTPSIHIQPTADSIARDIVFGIAPPAVVGTEASWQLSARPNTETPPSSFAIANYPGGVFTPRLTLTTGGNVGIGTANPASKLTILQGSDSQITGTAGLRLINTAQTAVTQILTGGDNGSYFFNGTGNNYLMISSIGHVGIGITNPEAALHVIGTSDQVAVFQRAPGAQRWAVNLDDNAFGLVDLNAGANAYGMYMLPNPIRISLGRAQVTPHTLYVHGSAAKPGGSSWSDYSDVRLKKNIGPLTGALERMLALRGVAFEWKAPASHGNLTGTQMGMVGQEVMKVFPEWVSEDPDGLKILSIRGFEALTVEAFREQQQEIEKLKREVESLRREKR